MSTANIQELNGDYRHLCKECFNKEVAEYMGIDLTPIKQAITEFMDVEGNKHKFKIERLIFPTGIGLEATEITKDGNTGYKIAVMGDIDCDQADLYKKLNSKIVRVLSKKYLKKAKFQGMSHITIKNEELVGLLVHNEESDGRVPKVVIDGKDHSWEELGRILSSREGFQVKIQIYDMTDDIT